MIVRWEPTSSADWQRGVAAAGRVGFVLWRAFVLVGSSNGVNLTDGLDGLAAAASPAPERRSRLGYLSGHRVLAGHLSIAHVPGAAS